MYCIEYDVEEGEMGCDEFLWLDTLLMDNFTEDPKKNYEFDRVGFSE